MSIPNRNGDLMTSSDNRLTAVPPTPGEVAVASAEWERRGVLGRLVRLDPPARDDDEETFPTAA
ncbi:MAG: hypothetical protein ABI948_10990 [Thermoleophilia bacterium]